MNCTACKNKAGIIEQYAQLLPDDKSILIKDISFADRTFGSVITIVNYLRSRILQICRRACGSRVQYDPYSTDVTSFPIGFAAPLGLLLPCNHIYNQYVFIGDAQQTMRKMESKKLRLQSLAAYSRENAAACEATNDFLNEAVNDQKLTCESAF